MLEEGIAGVREIDLGLMMGTGMVPGPFARADFRGLDDVLAALERAEQEWGEHFAPPLVLRRLVAQGRLGAKSGQGFYPYPQPEPGLRDSAVVKLDRRGDDVAVLWLDNPPANSLSPQVDRGARRRLAARSRARREAVIIASPNPALFCAGADIKSFTKMDEAGGKDLADRGHALLRSFERSRTMTIAAVNGLALGGGCELAMACDVRIAGFSASFGQPEINLGIIPGFGGTQRLPRLVGPAKALEMNTTGDPIGAEEAYEYGLVNRVVADHELFDTALAWARKFARQAPLALEQIKRVSHAGDLDEGIEAEKAALRRRRSRPRTRARASAPSSASARRGSRALELPRRPPPPGWPSCCARPTGWSRSPAPASRCRRGSPTSARRAPALWANVDPMEVAHIAVFRRDPERFWHFYGDRFAMLRDKRPNGAHRALVELERRGIVEAVVTQNIDGLHRAAGTARPDRGARHDRHLVVPGAAARATSSTSSASASGAAADGVPRCDCGAALKPDVVLFGELLPEAALTRASELAAAADVLLCVGSSLEVYPVAELPRITLAAGGAVALVTKGPTPYDRDAR